MNSPIWHKKEELAKSGTSFNIGDYHEFANCGVTGFWYWTEGVDKSAASGSRYYGPYRNKKDAAKARNDFFAIKRFGE